MFNSLDLETTGLPNEENNRTKITELSMVAAKRDHLLITKPGEMPRVQHKLTLCFNPRKRIHDASTEISGLNNDILEFEPPFDEKVIQIIVDFINLLTKPVCLVAHNGNKFDYPILQNVLMKYRLTFPEDLFCADTLHCFKSYWDTSLQETMEKAEHFETITTIAENTLLDCTDKVEKLPEEFVCLQESNEITPKRPKKDSVNPIPNKPRTSFNQSGIAKARRSLPFSQENNNYKLRSVYERLFNKKPVDMHNAEGPLVLVALIWGGTNPFIKRGTKGVKDVRSSNILEQFYLEVVYLLSNWQYVVPFLINQIGSVIYFFTLQSSQLSIAVPITNSLTFVFTAVAGWLVGEEPLTKKSLLGILLIIIGTSLCYTDNT